MKKGILLIEELGKFLIALALLLILIGLVIIFSGKGGELIEKLKEIFTYG